jgi:hypothetical protein
MQAIPESAKQVNKNRLAKIETVALAISRSWQRSTWLPREDLAQEARLACLRVACEDEPYLYRVAQRALARYVWLQERVVTVPRKLRKSAIRVPLEGACEN